MCSHRGAPPRTRVVPTRAGCAGPRAADSVGGGGPGWWAKRFWRGWSACPLSTFHPCDWTFFFLDDYTVISWYPWGNDSRTHRDTTICRLSSPFVQPPTPASTGSTNHGSCTTDLWTTWVWTAWVHLHVDFLQLTRVSVNPCNTEKKKSTHMDLHSSNAHCSEVNYCCVFSQRKRIAFKEYSFLGLPWWFSG